MPKYLVKQGLEYPPNRVVLVGEIVDDIPSRSVKWLREQGIIEAYDANAKAAIDEPVDDEPVIPETVVEEPAAEEPVVEETPVAEEPQADETVRTK